MKRTGFSLVMFFAIVGLEIGEQPVTAEMRKITVDPAGTTAIPDPKAQSASGQAPAKVAAPAPATSQRRGGPAPAKVAAPKRAPRPTAKVSPPVQAAGAPGMGLGAALMQGIAGGLGFIIAGEVANKVTGEAAQDTATPSDEYQHPLSNETIGPEEYYGSGQ